MPERGDAPSRYFLSSIWVPAINDGGMPERGALSHLGRASAPVLTDLVVIPATTIEQGDATHYQVVEADTRLVVMGPFSDPHIAIGVAHSLATKRKCNVWREVPGAPPVLCSPPSGTA